MRKKIVATAMGAALLAGGGLGAALMVPSTATAASGGTTTTATDSTTDPKPGAWMTAALKKLVDAGTINQAQADAVAKALESARPPGGPDHGGRRPGLTAAAKAIGISESDLRTALQSGQTIADVARAKGVDVTARDRCDRDRHEQPPRRRGQQWSPHPGAGRRDEGRRQCARHRSRQRQAPAPRGP